MCWNVTVSWVFRQHGAGEGMIVDSAVTVAKQQDIPAYIKSQTDAGLDW